MWEEPIRIGKIKQHNKGEIMNEVELEDKKKSKSKDISKMTISELRKLHEKKTETYWEIRNELNRIAKLIQKKGGK